MDHHSEIGITVARNMDRIKKYLAVGTLLYQHLDFGRPKENWKSAMISPIQIRVAYLLSLAHDG
jgi:hypothetical protein